MNATINKDIRGGVPCISGTRFPISQLLSELAEADRSLDSICREFNIPVANASSALMFVSQLMDQRFDDWMDADVRRTLESALPAADLHKLDECHDRCMTGRGIMLNAIGKALKSMKDDGK